MNTVLNTLLVVYAYGAGTLVGLLIHLLIIAIVFAAIWYILTLIPLPPPIGQVMRVIVAVIAVIFLIYLLLGIAGCAQAPTPDQVKAYTDATHTVVHNGVQDYKEVKQATR